jgi:bifunctional oligoribonuclease and PAP phosphatase NrnA
MHRASTNFSNAPRKMKNNPHFIKAWDAFRQADKIFLATHESTDGDDLGSLLAIRMVLERMGKEVHSAVKGGVPHTLKFLPHSVHVKSEFENQPYDLVVTFGCNVIERTGFEGLSAHPATKINFDHHPDNRMFADINIVEPKTAAVAELVFYFLKSNPEVVVDRDIATVLLTGIFADTGGFKHSNTSPEVYQTAAELLKRGARIDSIARQTLSTGRPQAARAWARALENARFDTQRQMAFSVMTEEDLREVQAEEEDLAGFVTMLNHIPQAKFALFLRQHGNEIKGSLRSDPYKKTDVSQIAKFFGGGGHKYASGFKIKGKLSRGDKGWHIVQEK